MSKEPCEDTSADDEELFDGPVYTVGLLGACLSGEMLRSGHPAIIAARLDEIERNIIEIKALLAM